MKYGNNRIMKIKRKITTFQIGNPARKISSYFITDEYETKDLLNEAEKHYRDKIKLWGDLLERKIQITNPNRDIELNLYNRNERRKMKLGALYDQWMVNYKIAENEYLEDN